MEIADGMLTVCPKCRIRLKEVGVYCQWCGHKLFGDDKVSVGKEILMYVVSLALPPFGLGWALKYLRLGTPQGKRIALIIFILTAVSLLGTILAFKSVMGYIQKSYNEVNSMYSFDKLIN
jgi:hypothetical protein